MPTGVSYGAEKTVIISHPFSAFAVETYRYPKEKRHIEEKQKWRTQKQAGVWSKRTTGVQLRRSVNVYPSLFDP